jgi:exopolyphosphatase / guanosine-5'-triphosphate,3'-diphosphate pyrophosphatase
LNTVNGPSGDARSAAVVSRDRKAERNEAGDCGGGGPAQVAARARSNAPAHGLPAAAESKDDTGASARAHAPSIYGALDLGTNNCRLLIAKPSRRGFLVIDAFSRIIRLGEGVLTSGRLSQAAMSRTIEALKVCAEKMRRRAVTRSRLIATEACRIAANSGEFIDNVRRETGLSIEIVTQETEAKLAVSGCASLLDRNCDWALVFDIGGGSSELIWLDLARMGGPWRRTLHERLDVQGCIAAWTSLPIGVVNLAERHGGRDVTPEGYEAMVADVMASAAPFEKQHRFGERIAGKRAHFLGTSGTVTTISGIHLKLPVYERSRVDGCWLSARDVRTVSGDLIAMTYPQRVAQPCIGHERADLVLAGCAILEALLRIWPCQRLRVADRGLREGILATLMAEDGHERRGNRQGGGGSPGPAVQGNADR